MELYNNEVPAGEVWALLVRGRGTFDEYEFVEWFITAPESSAEYRAAVAERKRHGGGTVQRWKVTLPRRRMSADEVTAYVEDLLLLDPDGRAQLLDVSISPAPDRRR